MINDPMLSMEMRLGNAAIVHELLTKALPLSRALFKYIGFVATK
jgi:hypothetical protein